VDDPRSQSLLQSDSDSREMEIEELRQALEHERSLNLIQNGRHAASLMEDPMLRGWITESRAETHRQLEVLPLDAPQPVIIGLRAYLAAITKLEQRLMSFVQTGTQAERRIQAPQYEEE